MNLQQAQVISNSDKVRGAVSLRDDFNHFRRKYLTYSLLPFTSYLGVLHFATLPFISPSSDGLHAFLTQKGKKRNFFADYGVDITVLKTLWKMLKTFGASRKIQGDRLLWENLRKNIFHQKGRKKGVF